MQSDPERRARGAQKLGEILGQSPDQVDRSLGDVAPQLATYVLETIYGEIYQSEVLDSRTRQIVTVAALATLGTAVPQLRTHIGGALRCGKTTAACTDHHEIEAVGHTHTFPSPALPPLHCYMRADPPQPHPPFGLPDLPS